MNKSNLLIYFTILLFGFLGLRIVQLQVLEHDKYKTLAKNNTTRSSVTRAPRGIIYDRHGQILATSKQSLSVIVYPSSLRKKTKKENVAKLLSNFISLDYDELKKIFDELDPSTPLPITLDNDVNIETAIKIYENKKYLPGIAVEEQATRYYPYHDNAAHIIGYVGQINNRELRKGKARGLGLGDLVGKDGLEKVFDNVLQGQKGEARVAVDRYGKSLDANTKQQKANKTIKKAIKGADLHLTIDIELQKVAQDAMKDQMAAVVAVNPKNGEILVLASEPSFDPNIFTKPVPTKVFNELMTKKAFINRSTSSYTPGSVWKPFTALAALEHGVASNNEHLEVSDAVMMGGFRFGDWTGKKDIMNLSEALVWSRNTFFYQIAKRMKPEWISDLARLFGAGSKTGVEILGESSGTVPDPKWKKKHIKEQWFPGNTLHLSIGQSYILLTPLQVAKMYSGLANEGFLPDLHLIKNPRREKLNPAVSLSKESMHLVKTALKACVRRGTGQASKLADVEVAGKTGSAEVKGYDHSTHGWFASYAPAEDPEIVVVVFVEGGGHGGSVAAPIARKVHEAYFNRKKEAKPEGAK